MEGIALVTVTKPSDVHRMIGKIVRDGIVREFA